MHGKDLRTEKGFLAVQMTRGVSLVVRLTMAILTRLIGMRWVVDTEDSASGLSMLTPTEAAALSGMLRRILDRKDGQDRWMELLSGELVQKNEYLRTVNKEVISLARSLEATNAELETTRDYLDNLIQNSADMIVATGQGRIVTLFNRRAQEILGYRAEEVIGRSVEVLYQKGETKRVEENLRIAPDGRLMEHEVRLRTKGGIAIPARLTASLLYDETGRVTGSFGACTDLTHIKALEEELVKQQKVLAIAELGGAASHELNQPLTVALGRIQLIRRRQGRHGPYERELRHVERELQKMAQMVRRIGQITRYETAPYVGASRILDLKGSVIKAPKEKQKPQRKLMCG